MLVHTRRNACGAVVRRGGSTYPGKLYAEISQHTLSSPRSDVGIPFSALRHRHLVVDTVDSLGNLVLPERIHAIVPRLKSVLKGANPFMISPRITLPHELCRALSRPLAAVRDRERHGC